MRIQYRGNKVTLFKRITPFSQRIKFITSKPFDIKKCHIYDLKALSNLQKRGEFRW